MDTILGTSGSGGGGLSGSRLGNQLGDIMAAKRRRTATIWTTGGGVRVDSNTTLNGGGIQGGTDGGGGSRGPPWTNGGGGGGSGSGGEDPPGAAPSHAPLTSLVGTHFNWDVYNAVFASSSGEMPQQASGRMGSGEDAFRIPSLDFEMQESGDYMPPSIPPCVADGDGSSGLLDTRGIANGSLWAQIVRDVMDVTMMPPHPVEEPGMGLDPQPHV